MMRPPGNCATASRAGELATYCLRALSAAREMPSRDGIRRLMEVTEAGCGHPPPEVVHAGDGRTPLVPEQGQGWDAVLLVRHPSREAFSAEWSPPRSTRRSPTGATQTVTEGVLPP
jgi:hypothetical protein